MPKAKKEGPMLLVRILNVRIGPEDCIAAVQKACLGVKGFELGADQLLLECSRDIIHTWSRQPMIIVTVDVCFPAENISEEVRRKLARKIASAVKRTRDGKHQAVKVVVRDFRPEEIVIHREPAEPVRRRRRGRRK
ncbi:hypothetical protein KKD80_01995 [Patescibacteria group bacterium]|nr:hypothetical protein [Patescibacteria group bacterium]